MGAFERGCVFISNQVGKGYGPTSEEEAMGNKKKSLSELHGANKMAGRQFIPSMVFL